MNAFSSPNDRRRTSYLAAALGLTATFALAFAGCSEPAPIIPKAAWAVSFIDPGIGCSIAGHNKAIGDVSADKRGKLFEDAELITAGNENTAVSVDCSVIPSGSGFSVSASASANGLVLFLVVDNLTTDATKDNPAKGTVSYTSLVDTATAFTSQNCSFYFLPSTGQTVKAGDVWLTFDCQDIAASSDNICVIDPAYVAFEKCTSTADEE